MYRIFLRPIFFLFPPESIHHFVFLSLKFFLSSQFLSRSFSRIYHINDKRLQRTIFGLTFKNPVGLAAGFDKNAVLTDELACLGFGFIEIGTVTPKPQPGNAKPRMFRLPKDNAILNRMGFNNDGVHEIANRLKKRKSDVLIGVNIGKNKDTPNELAIEDYACCFENLFDTADYFVVNVSSPNTPGLRDLQEKEPLKKLLNHLVQLNKSKPNPKPILLKISPDLDITHLNDVIEIVRSTGLHGIIATNTTVNKDNLLTAPEDLAVMGSGGISGDPLDKRSTEVIRYLHENLGDEVIIIASGGINSKAQAMEKINAGASLLQLYTGFVYEGPALIKEINRAILNREKNK